MRRALISIGMLLPSTGLAEPDPYVERPFALSAHGGFGTPLGFYGIAADVAVRRRLSIEAGIGQGLVGTQLAVQARARVVRVESYWFAFGVGLSEGHYEHRDPFFGIEYIPTVVDRAFWANVELSFERRTLAGFHTRFYAGAGVVFAGERERCGDGDFGSMPCSGSARGLRTPYVGASIGYAPKF